MPSINVSIFLLALMVVSPLGSNAVPQAQASSAKSSAAASSAAKASSVAAKSSSAAAVTSTIKPTTTSSVAKSITPSSAVKSSSVPAASSAAKSSAVASASKASVAVSSSKASVAASASASKASSSVSASKAASSTSAALTSPSGVAINAGSADATALLKLHNDFRAHYGASVLTWDNNLAAFAQKTSNTCKFAHSGGPNGETLAAGAGGGFNYTSGFGLWTKEAAKYNWKTPGYSSATGHFTQVVWKATTKVGCGVTKCPDKTIFSGYGTSTYLVCEYQTPGNVVGNNSSFFVANVGTYR